MKTLDILPVFLQEGHQEVHGEPHVLDQLVLGHLNIAHSHAQAEDLLHLELDGGLQVVDLGLHVVGVGDHGGELASFVEARAQQPGDLLDQGVGAEEGIITLGQLLDLLLVLVELLEVIR